MEFKEFTSPEESDYDITSSLNSNEDNINNAGSKQNEVFNDDILDDIPEDVDDTLDDVVYDNNQIYKTYNDMFGGKQR